MTPRWRLGVASACLVVLTGLVVALHHAQEASPPETFSLSDFAAPHLLVTDPREPPRPPAALEAHGGPSRTRIAWGSALTGQTDPSGAAGYEVTWHRDGEPARTRRVASPEVQLDDLAIDTDYEVGVRSVDAFGRRSAWTTVRARAGDDGDWRSGLTGLLEDFDDPGTIDPSRVSSRWHLDGYRGCVNTGTDPVGLVVEMICGADSAVLRARTPLRLSEVDGELGRVGVLTDVAGPRGALTVDLVPGSPDRIGSTELDRGLPREAVRVVVDDHGARVLTGTDVPSVPGSWTAAAPRRGTGVLHRFDVVLTTSGVQVLQDGALVGSSGAVPWWRVATVLIGLHGAGARQNRAHVDAIGFTGARSPVRGVVETTVVPGTQQVLDPDEAAPGVGISRGPLRGASAARLRATVLFDGSADPAQLVAQLGDVRVPLRPEVSGVVGGAVTVVGDLPPELLGAAGPDSLTPFVLRMPGGRASRGVVRAGYLEIESTSDGPPTQPSRLDRRSADVLPTPTIAVHGVDDRPVLAGEVLGPVRVVLRIGLDGIAAEAGGGSVAGVAGFQIRIDSALVASVPTTRGGPGLGGDYAVGLELGRLPPGEHVVELRVFPVERGVAEQSALLTVTTRSSR
jgi:hypothetical protein